MQGTRQPLRLAACSHCVSRTSQNKPAPGALRSSKKPPSRHGARGADPTQITGTRPRRNAHAPGWQQRIWRSITQPLQSYCRTTIAAPCCALLPLCRPTNATLRHASLAQSSRQIACAHWWLVEGKRMQSIASPPPGSDAWPSLQPWPFYAFIYAVKQAACKVSSEKNFDKAQSIYDGKHD